MGIVSSNRIMDLLDADEHIANNGTYAPSSLEGKVEFQNVHFAYDDENFVLKDITFNVEPGQTVALVGATGAGKSSVINLLSRFYEIQKGSISVDDRSIEDYDMSSLRRHIGVVLQDVFLFSDSIYNNITLGNPEISKEKVEHSAELVGAKEFIEKLKKINSIGNKAENGKLLKS